MPKPKDLRSRVEETINSLDFLKLDASEYDLLCELESQPLELLEAAYAASKDVFSQMQDSDIITAAPLLNAAARQSTLAQAIIFKALKPIIRRVEEDKCP